MTNYDGKVLLVEQLNPTTDGSGNATLTLTYNPTNIDSIMIFTREVQRYVEKVSLTGNSLSIKIFKAQYDKLTTVTTPLTSLTGGVSEQTGATITTSSVSAVSAGTGTSTAATTHTHTIAQIFSHDHQKSYTTTDKSVVYANTESINLIIVYGATIIT